MSGKRTRVVFAGLLGATSMAPGTALAAARTAGASGSIVTSFALSLGLCALGGIVLGLAGYGAYCLVDRARSSASSRIDASSRAEEPSAPASDDSTAVGEKSPYVPRHMAPAKEEGGRGRALGRGARGVSGDHVATAAAKSDSHSDDAPRAQRPDHAARGYEDIAQNYVDKKSFRRLMATRAQGVAAILSSRIGGGRMDGLPVIERADGSVGDVGTSWWSAAVGPSISGPLDLTIEDRALYDDLTIPCAGDGLQFMPSVSAPAPKPAEAQASERRDITRRVALVDEESFPAERTVDELGSDEWETALEAMEDKIANVSAELFADVVGGIETIDEPDGLEANTQFLSFRPHGGHPEVVDTSSYVDFLLAEEMRDNSSEALRRSSRNYLQVIEGGTHASTSVLSPEPAKGRPSKAKGAYRGRHFAPSHAEALQEALEA